MANANTNNIGVPVMDPYFVYTERPRPKSTRTQKIGGGFVLLLFMLGIIKLCLKIHKINKQHEQREAFSNKITNLRNDLEIEELNRRTDMLLQLQNLNITSQSLIQFNKLNSTSEMFMKDSFSMHRVIISHTATDNCYNEVACRKQIEDFKSSPFPNLRKHYMIGGNGKWYKGPNFLNTEGLHAKGNYSDAMCITLIGTFSIFLPPPKQMNAVHSVILLSKIYDSLVENYRLYGARQFMNTESPGDDLYETIQNWEHWSDNIENMTEETKPKSQE